MRSITPIALLPLALLAVVLTHSAPAAEPPIRTSAQLFNQKDPRSLGLPTAPGQHTLLYRATKDSYKYSHHANLGVFKDRLYVAWSSGIEHEDENGQRVLYCHSDDGVSFSKPEVLIPDPDGLDGEMGSTCAGFFATETTFIAYYTRFVHSEPVHERNTVHAVTSKDAKNWSSPHDLTAGFFIERPRRLLSGRLLMNGQQPSRAHRQPRLRYTDATDGLRGWKDATIPEADVYSFPEPTWFQRPDSTIVMLFRARSQKADGRLYASTSADNGVTWTRPVRTSYPDATARSSAGNLPDSTAFIINNPSHTPGPVPRIGHRIPLVISLSRDGSLFDRAFVIRNEETTYRFKGTHKLPGWQYPGSIVWRSHLYVAYSINKEDVGITRISLAALSE